MGHDRFVRFDGARPSALEVKACLRAYLGGVTSTGIGKGPRLVAYLPGRTSRAFQAVGPATGAQRAAWREQAGERRAFEVYIGDDYVDVITRFADELTCAVADGFVDVLVRGWRGRLDG